MICRSDTGKDSAFDKSDRFCSYCGKERAADAPPFAWTIGKVGRLEGCCPDCLEIWRAWSTGSGTKMPIRQFCSHCGKRRDVGEYLWPRGVCCFTWSDHDYYDAWKERQAYRRAATGEVS